MRFRKNAETLFLRPEMDSGCGFQPLLGDAHVDACGMEIEGLRPFDATRGGNGLQAAPESKRGGAALAFAANESRALPAFVR